MGDAIRWAWNKFTQNAVAFLVPVLAYSVALAALIGVLVGLSYALSDRTTTTYIDEYGATNETVNVGMTPATGIIMFLGYIALFVLVMSMHAGIVTGALDLADGKPVTIGTFFKPRNLSIVLLTGLMVAILTAIGSLLCIIPGLIFGFLAQFAITVAVDRATRPIDSVKGSISTIRSNIGGSVLSSLVQYAAVLVGELLCLVGLFVAFPIAVLIQTYTYRKLSGGQVVEVSQPAPLVGPPPGPPPRQQFA